jgi:CDP-diacylglycerol--glycerol-3-phosphate 3-phosphatidyltransferase
MYPMIQSRFKAPVTRVITPICRGLLRVGVSANALTVFGTLGVCISALYFFGSDQLFLGTIFISFFALSDLFDGTMARLSNQQGTKWGALLDSTLDRISDAAIAIGIWLYLRNLDSDFQYVALALLLIGGLIPYIRARAESLGIECSVGIAERAERLIITLAGTGLTGLNVPFALEISLMVLVLLSVVTVIQRMRVVYRS